MQYLHTMVRISSIEQSLDFYCTGLGMVEVTRKENQLGRFTLIFLLRLRISNRLLEWERQC